MAWVWVDDDETAVEDRARGTRERWSVPRTVWLLVALSACLGTILVGLVFG